MSGYMKSVKDREKKAPHDCEKGIAFAKYNERLSPYPKRVLNECGISGGEAVFTSPDNPSVTLAAVNLDLSCFKKPQIIIEFSSQVTFEGPLDMLFTLPSVDSEIVLDYTLVSNQNGSEVNIGNWTYERLIPAATISTFMGVPITTTDTFSFNKCICQSLCPGCITYFVRVKARVVTQRQDFTAMQAVPNARATVFNGEIIASVQEM